MQKIEWNGIIRPEFKQMIPSALSTTTPLSDASIPVLIQDRGERFAIFEGDYTQKAEPWNYSHRAIEQLRHDWVIKHLQEIPIDSTTRVLEIGCSLGLMTEKLTGLGGELFAMDLSPTAVQKAAVRLQKQNLFPHFLVADASTLPFEPNTFDVVTICDGLHGWHLDEATQKKVSAEVFRVLKPGGVAFFTDYIHRKAFHQVRSLAQSSGLKIIKESLLGDILWYQFASAFKAIESWTFVRRILSSLTIGRALQKISLLMGEHGSRHILVIARKPEL